MSNNMLDNVGMNNKIKTIHVVFVVSLGLMLSLSAQALDIKTWKTDNGVEVLFVESHALPIVDVRLNFKAGSSRDSACRLIYGSCRHLMKNAR